MKKVLITGSRGMLGKDIVRTLSTINDYTIYAINRKIDTSVTNSYDIDMRDHEKILSVVKDINPDVIIHAAALVDVDFCEKNKKIAYDINVNASKRLAALTKKMVYISTDSVYSGVVGNFKETDSKDPINYYALTKSIAEDEVMKTNPDSVILRTNIYGYHTPIGRSLFEWGYKSLSQGSEITGFDDVFFNPLYTEQLAYAIRVLLDINYSGVINIGSDKPLSKYDFLIKLANTFKFDEKLIRPISVDKGVLGAKRPKNTTLNINKMEEVTGLSFSVKFGLEQLHKDFYNTNNKLIGGIENV